jgi:hypothetical protein
MQATLVLLQVGVDFGAMVILSLLCFIWAGQTSLAQFPAFLPLLQAAFPNVKGCDGGLFWDMKDKFTFPGKEQA